MRQLSTGMDANLDGGMKRDREELLRKIKILDNVAKVRGLSEGESGEGYKLEGQLEDIFAYEEQIWQHRSSGHWLLEGDSNLVFFIALQMAEEGSAIFRVWNRRRVPYMKKRS
jgi:hypothetical protein